MKRFRDENGNLKICVNQVAELTAAEAADYYKIGSIYFNQSDGAEYIYIKNDDDIAHFQSFTGLNLFNPRASLGTFLPDVASEGFELIFVE